MNPRFGWILLFVALGLTLAPTSHPVEGNQRVTLVSDPWPPYVLGETGNEAVGGVGVEVLRTIFDCLDGVELSIPLLPWNRALREVERGTKDGIGILLKTREREAYMEYTDEVFRSYNAVWYFAGRFPGGFDWQEYVDLKPYNIGVISGHSYGQELDQSIADGLIRVIEVPSAHQLFTMLEKGRIDLAIADRLVGESFVARYKGPGKRLLAASKPAAIEVYYIAFSRKSAARSLIPALNSVLSRLQREGVIRRMIGTVPVQTAPAN